MAYQMLHLTDEQMKTLWQGENFRTNGQHAPVGVTHCVANEQVKGDDYTVNESHILSLKMTKAGKKGDKHQTILGKRYYKNDIVDICIKENIEIPERLRG